MMKTSRLIMSCWIMLFLALTSVSATQKFKTINDLKKINFGQSVPSHSLLLLYWFANEVDIDNNHVIRLTFNPNNGDYGSHHYGNYERLLEPLPQGYRYYTVGNLNQEMTSMQLPSYVVHPRIGFEGRNRDRIIFRVRQQNVEWQAGQIIDRVFITQHYETSDNQGTRYDPAHTYQVTNSLLRHIREFSAEESGVNLLVNLRDRFGSNADDAQLRYIRNSWGNLACLGLLLFIVIQEKNTADHHNNRRQPKPKRNTHPDFVVNIPERRQNGVSGMFVSLQLDQPDEIILQVVTGTNGKASIFWNNVPKSDLKEGVMVVLYKNNEDEKALTYKFIGDMKTGTYKTSVPLNEGLQVRMHKVRKLWCFWSGIGEEIYRGDEFKNPPAVSISGYNASLQLFAKDGKACARLFVKKSFNDWRSKFKNSWIGFYSSPDKATKNYEWWQWQWATKLNLSTDYQDSTYDVYEYHSGMAIAPGVQVRFILRDEVEQARTPRWRE
ncbi:uncharacterized protein LOC121650860 [Melanotaenia boesemani]|uniref:uncharacterized protein LOC121650860 n=1 Tax=Melanotaenia boesemani TaxID=1250792 RepID=UPI001C045C43|nr:uncharacterized protein LOC121650860 [Melanotaenia boesemani]